MWTSLHPADDDLASTGKKTSKTLKQSLRKVTTAAGRSRTFGLSDYSDTNDEAQDSASQGTRGKHKIYRYIILKATLLDPEIEY